MSKLLQADNWFAILDPWKDEPTSSPETIEIHRVVLWKDTPNGVVGLVSPALSGGVLQEAETSLAGTVYKHLDDLSEREREALKLKNRA
ncbi:hypothetical protein [Vibrio harveyi]|uniref:hypothetical protein n=1 Tax=Vibrio harveyi TaxID=669 RepID=UPI00248184C6|nr:hypothetical protein [Vibrio harveyi]